MVHENKPFNSDNRTEIIKGEGEQEAGSNGVSNINTTLKH